MTLSRQQLEEMQGYAVEQFEKYRGGAFTAYDGPKIATSAATAAATIQLALNQLDETEAARARVSGPRLTGRPAGIA